jgi:hypothetical protein
MKRILFLIYATLAINFSANSQTIDLFFQQADVFLSKNVTDDGKVDYETIKKSPGELFYILDQAAKLNLKSETKDVAKAFWINAYNLQCIKMVVERYPLKSVLEHPSFFKRDNFLIANQDVTLNDIENVILREILFDPGYHFVLSSAAIGSSPLLNKAYMPQTVSEQIKEQARKIINSKGYFIFEKDIKTVFFPQIFEWYKKDFVINYFNEIDFANLFLEKKLDNTYNVKYYKFNWDLNDVTHTEKK